MRGQTRQDQGKQSGRTHLVFNVLDQRLELLFELAPDTRPRHDRREVNGQYALVLQGLEHTMNSATGRGQRNEQGRIYLRNFLCNYPLREPFEDGRLADTGRTDELQVATTKQT